MVLEVRAADFLMCPLTLSLTTLANLALAWQEMRVLSAAMVERVKARLMQVEKAGEYDAKGL